MSAYFVYELQRPGQPLRVVIYDTGEVELTRAQHTIREQIAPIRFERMMATLSQSEWPHLPPGSGPLTISVGEPGAPVQARSMDPGSLPPGLELFVRQLDALVCDLEGAPPAPLMRVLASQAQTPTPTLDDEISPRWFIEPILGAGAIICFQILVLMLGAFGVFQAFKNGMFFIMMMGGFAISLAGLAVYVGVGFALGYLCKDGPDKATAAVCMVGFVDVMSSIIMQTYDLGFIIGMVIALCLCRAGASGGKFYLERKTALI